MNVKIKIIFSLLFLWGLCGVVNATSQLYYHNGADNNDMYVRDYNSTLDGTELSDVFPDNLIFLSGNGNCVAYRDSSLHIWIYYVPNGTNHQVTNVDSTFPVINYDCSELYYSDTIQKYVYKVDNPLNGINNGVLWLSAARYIKDIKDDGTELLAQNTSGAWSTYRLSSTGATIEVSESNIYNSRYGSGYIYSGLGGIPASLPEGQAMSYTNYTYITPGEVHLYYRIFGDNENLLGYYDGGTFKVYDRTTTVTTAYGGNMGQPYFDILDDGQYVPPGYDPPVGSNCYTQLMNSGYNFINKSVLGKNQADYTQYYNTSYDSNTGHASVGYQENSTGEKHVYSFYNMYEIDDYTAVDWFTTSDTFNFSASDYPWDYDNPYINISRYGGIDYIKVYGTGAEENHNDFQIRVFASNGIDVEGTRDFLLGGDRRFNFGEYIDFSNYTDDTIYAVLIGFDRWGGFGDLFGAEYEIGGVEYGPYEIEQTEYEICIEPDGTVYRDGVAYTGSLDESGDLPPLPSVGTELPEYTPDLDGFFAAIQDFFAEIWGRIISIKNAGNNLIQLIKEILKLGQTDEVRTLGMSWFIPEAEANESPGFITILDSKSTYISEEDNPRSRLFRFMVRGILFIVFLMALLLLLM